MILGIDNGLDGGIVALSPMEGVQPIAKVVLPTLKVHYQARYNAKGKMTAKAKTRREIDPRALCVILNGLNSTPENTEVYFEECPEHADRAATMRSMAMSAGKIISILEAKGYEVNRIMSYDWHPVILGKIPKGQSKTMARAKAAELWPDENWLATDRSTTTHDGLIDAALIAEFGRRKLYPKPTN